MRPVIINGRATAVLLQRSPGAPQPGGFNLTDRGILGAGSQIKGPAIVSAGFVGTVSSAA